MQLIILTLFFLFFRVGPVLAITIKINEFYAAGSTSSNPDWVEIYNDGADISLYQLRDSSATNKKDLSGANCNGNYCTIDWYNYLNNSGDTVKLILKTAPDSPIDQVVYGGTGDISIPLSGQSGSRNPDGEGNWIISTSPTKGLPNNPSTPAPTSIPTPTPSPISSSTSLPTPIPSPTSNSSASKKSTTSTKTPSPTSNTTTPAPTVAETMIAVLPVKPSPKIDYHVASVAAAVATVTPSPQVEVKNQKQTNAFLWSGIILIFAGVSLLGYIYLRKNANTHIKLRRRY